MKRDENELDQAIVKFDNDSTLNEPIVRTSDFKYDSVAKWRDIMTDVDRYGHTTQQVLENLRVFTTLA